MPLSELISIASGALGSAMIIWPQSIWIAEVVFWASILLSIGSIIWFLAIKFPKFLSRKIPLNLAAKQLWELIEKQEESKGKSSAGYRDPEETLKMCVQYFLSAELVYGEVPPSRRMVKVVDDENQSVWSNGSDSNLYDLSGNILYENAFLYKRALKNYLKNFKY
jgi:hypothetical protein